MSAFASPCLWSECVSEPAVHVRKSTSHTALIFDTTKLRSTFDTYTDLQTNNPFSQKTSAPNPLYTKPVQTQSCARQTPNWQGKCPPFFRAAGYFRPNSLLFHIGDLFHIRIVFFSIQVFSAVEKQQHTKT